MKKETVASKKASKKTTKKYTYVVDLTKAETAADVYDAFIDAKIKAGMPITEVEMIRAKAHIVDLVFDTIDDITIGFDKNVTTINDDKFVKDFIKFIDTHVNKKDPWYKRAWKWVKKPFCKK